MTASVLLLAPARATGGIATWADIFRRELSGKFRCTLVDTSPSGVSEGEVAPTKRRALGVLDAIARLIQLGWHLRTSRPDVVYFTVSPGPGFLLRDTLLMNLLGALRVPYIVHLHGGSIPGFLPDSWLAARWVQPALVRAAAVISITSEVYGALTRGKLRNAHLVPNMLADRTPPVGVPRAASASTQHLINVGWQTRSKGTLALIQLAAESPDVRLTLVGPVPPDMEKPLFDAITSSGVRDRVLITGLLTPGEVRSHLDEATVYVTASQGEGFPMSVLEAMAAGLPVLARDVGQIGEIIGATTDRPAGVLANTVSDMARTLRQVFADATRYEDMSHNALNRIAERYRAYAVMPHLEALLMYAVGGERSA